MAVVVCLWSYMWVANELAVIWLVVGLSIPSANQRQHRLIWGSLLHTTWCIIFRTPHCILPGSDSIQLLGGCYGTRYGCCDDGLTSAYGPRREGCPELEVVTMPITTTLITTTPYVSSRINVWATSEERKSSWTWLDQELLNTWTQAMVGIPILSSWRIGTSLYRYHEL